MRVLYTYDVAGIREANRKFIISFPSSRITYDELKDLLISDGAVLNDSSELRYFNESLKTYCTVPLSEPLLETSDLNIKIKRGYSSSASHLLSDIEQLKKRCQETKQNLDEREQKLKFSNRHRDSGARAPCKELDIVMLHASPLVHKTQPFEEPCLNFLQEIDLMVSQVNRTASIRFEIATPENLKELLEYHSKIVIISCEGFVNEANEFVLAVEKLDNPSDIGLLIEMNVEELKKLLAGNRFNQIVIVKSKKFREIGKIFIDIGISIVLAVEETEDSTSSMKFIIDVVNNLLEGKSIEEYQESISQDNELPQFQLFYTDESIKDQKFFNIEKEGPLEVLSEINSQFKPAPVKKFTVGRRTEIRDVIKAILDNRCVNVNGPCGVGKTMVLKRAAQYLYERRIFKAGVVYLDICMRTDIIFLYRYIAGLMNIPLSDRMSLADNEKILSSLNHIDILLIIDNIDRLDNKEKIVRDICKIMSDTDKPKLVIGSQSCLGITDSYNYLIPPLSLAQSKSLLLFHNKSIYLNELDEIVQNVGQKPSDLLQISPLLSDPLFDSACLHQYNKFVSIELSILHVQRYFPEFLTFLQILSYLPSGALNLNISEVSKKHGVRFDKILEFLNKEAGTWFVHTDPGFEFVLLRSYVMDYLSLVIPHNQDLAKSCLVHLAVFARSILKAYLASSDPISNQCRGSLFFINAGIDTGIWGPSFPEESEKLSQKVQSQFQDLNRTFEKSESNFWYYLNSKLIKEIFKLQDLELLDEDTGKAVGEILLCTTAIFILQGKKDDALIMISKGRELCSDLRLRKVKALLILTNASLYSSRKYDKNLKQQQINSSKNFDKAKNLAIKAKMKLSDNEEGLAESSFLINLLKLKVKSTTNSIITLRKTQSSSVETEADTEHVIDWFEKVNQKVGSARARLSYCKFILKERIEPKTIQYLEESIRIFDENRYSYWKTKAQLCLAKCYYEGLNWIKSREILNSIDQTQKDLNRVIIDSQIHKVNEKIKLNNKHAITFFFSSPLVEVLSSQVKRSKPSLRTQSDLVSTLAPILQSLHKQFCFRSEVLTRENFKLYLEDRPTILHLSCSSFNSKHFIFENFEGAADVLTPEDFSALCSSDLRSAGVELLVLAFPNSSLLGHYCYSTLKVRHVVAFQLLDISSDSFPPQVRFSIETAISRFCQEFYLKLLEGFSVRDSFQAGQESMKFSVDQDLKIFGEIKIDDKSFLKIWEEISDHEPILIDFQAEHHDFDLMTSTMPEGEPIMMSLPAGPNNLDDGRGFDKFVGRQIEMFKAMQELRKNGCVVVEGERGIGKTEFVKQAAWFLNERREFKDRIVYFSIKGKCLIEDIYQGLKANGIGVYPGYYYPASFTKSRVLLILDDCEDFSASSPHLFAGMIRYLLKDCHLNLILCSSTWIKPIDSVSISKIQLHPLTDAESKLLISIILPAFFPENYQAPEESEVIIPLCKLIIQLSKRVPSELIKLLSSAEILDPVRLLQKFRLRFWHLSHSSSLEPEPSSELANIISESEEEEN